jgi:hypothetical protein
LVGVVETFNGMSEIVHQMLANNREWLTGGCHWHPASAEVGTRLVLLTGRMPVADGVRFLHSKPADHH